jgi:hypothetical protein
VHGFVDSPAAANGNARVVLRRQEFLTQKILKRRNGDTENRRELDLVATWTETARQVVTPRQVVIPLLFPFLLSSVLNDKQFDQAKRLPDLAASQPR